MDVLIAALSRLSYVAVITLAADGFEPPPTVPITHNLRPAQKDRRIKDELGINAFYP